MFKLASIFLQQNGQVSINITAAKTESSLQQYYRSQKSQVGSNIYNCRKNLSSQQQSVVKLTGNVTAAKSGRQVSSNITAAKSGRQVSSNTTAAKMVNLAVIPLQLIWSS